MIDALTAAQVKKKDQILNHHYAVLLQLFLQRRFLSFVSCLATMTLAECIIFNALSAKRTCNATRLTKTAKSALVMQIVLVS